MAITRKPIDPATVLVGDPIEGDTLTATDARDAWASVRQASKTAQTSELVFCQRLAAFYDRGGPKAMGWQRQEGDSPVPYMAKVLGVSSGQVYRKINSGRLAQFLVARGQHVSGLQERQLREALPLMDHPETIVEATQEAAQESQAAAVERAKKYGKNPPRKVDIDPKAFRRQIRMRLPQPKPKSEAELRFEAIASFRRGLDTCHAALAVLGSGSSGLQPDVWLDTLGKWLEGVSRA